MSILIHRKLLFNLFISFNHKSSNFLTRLLHFSFSKVLMRKNSFEVHWVDIFKFINMLVVHISYSDICCVSWRKDMSTNYSCRSHWSNNLNSFKMNKLQISIIKSFVTYYLMKESNKLDCIIFIWLRQVNVF